MRAFVGAFTGLLSYLHTFFGVLGGLWLLYLGYWRIVAVGLMLMVAAAILLQFIVRALFLVAGIICYPITFLAIRVKSSTTTFFLTLPPLLLRGLFVSALQVVWTVGIFAEFWQHTGSNAIVPTLMWSYAVACYAWLNLARRVEDPTFVMISVFQDIGCIALFIYMALNIGRTTIVQMAYIFAIPSLISVVLNSLYAAGKSAFRTKAAS